LGPLPTSPSPEGLGGPVGQSPKAEDSALVAELLLGDRKAAAQFVERFSGRVHSYVTSRMMPRADLAEDLVQDIFLAAWENLRDFRGQAPLEAWLLGIARHKVEDHYRSRLRKLVSIEEEAVEAPQMAVLPEWDRMLDGEKLRRRTHRVLAALPEQYRLALLWRYWEKCPAQEMAARIGKSEKAVERLLARARSHFRREWENA
jgi:RNA polymerase sigma-70 factor, ECF subfamily